MDESLKVRAGQRKERSSFLKKRSKKLLCFYARVGEKSATASKSFLVLFFKKEHSFSFLPLKLPTFPASKPAKS